MGKRGSRNVHPSENRPQARISTYKRVPRGRRRQRRTGDEGEPLRRTYSKRSKVGNWLARFCGRTPLPPLTASPYQAGFASRCRENDLPAPARIRGHTNHVIQRSNDAAWFVHEPTTLRISWLDWDRGRRIFGTVSRPISLRFYRFRFSDRYFCLIYRTKLRPLRSAVLPCIVKRRKEQIRKLRPCFTSFRHSATMYNANVTVPSNEYSPIFLSLYVRYYI